MDGTNLTVHGIYRFAYQLARVVHGDLRLMTSTLVTRTM
jgi:hypothetical protein